MFVRRISRVVVLVASSSVAMVPAACSSSSQQAVERSEQTVDSLATLRSEVSSASQQVDRTITSLNTLTGSTGDRRAAFKTYSNEVAKLQSQAEKARERSADLRSRSSEYIAKWEAEVATVSDPELRAQARDRRAAVRDRIDEIRIAAERSRAAYEPLIRELLDIQTVVSNDLTDAGMQAVSATAKQANVDGATLRDRLAEFIAELDQLSGQMSPRG